MTAIFLSLLFAVSLAACGAKAPAVEDVKEETKAEGMNNEKR